MISEQPRNAGSKLERVWLALPRWARWVLYAPAVIAAAGLANFILLGSIGAADKTGVYLFIPVAFSAFVSTTLFYWASVYLAPSHTKIAAGLMYLLFILLWTATVIRISVGWFYGHQVQQIDVVELIQGLVFIFWSSILLLPALRSKDPLNL